MRKINTKDIAEESWTSPKGKFGGTSKEISVALGRKPRSTDLNERHPFDVELCRIPPGKTNSPHHSHSAQWEFYHVISGKGIVRDQEGATPMCSRSWWSIRTLGMENRLGRRAINASADFTLVLFTLNARKTLSASWLC